MKNDWKKNLNVYTVYEAGFEMINLGIHQSATYPLFRFPYTRLGREFQKNGNALATMFRRRKLLKIFEEIFYDSGFERSSVWAFTKKGIDKYCSVTVPLYLGLGVIGGTYWIHAFEDFFSIDYINKLWGTSKVNPMA